MSAQNELTRFKASYKKLADQLRDARKVIMLYRHWEHCSHVEFNTGDDADTDTMLMDASFAAQEFVEKWENQIKPIKK
jgi:hypothetical protein